MRARKGLGLSLWISGARNEAVAIYQDMLLLNPDDNQGIRWVLASWLLALGRNDELGSLLRTYEGDVSATWAYSSALLAFRRDGNSEQSRQALEKALDTNGHVLKYLLGMKDLPPSFRVI